MKIAIDTRIVSYVSSGISRYASGVVTALADSELHSHITLLRSWRAPKLPLPKTLQRAHLLTPSHFPYEHLSFPLEVAPRGYDIIHAMDFFCPPVTGAQLLFTIHDLYFLSHPDSMTAASFRHYQRLCGLVEKAAHVVCISESTRRDVLKHFAVSEEQCSTIYPGIDFEYWSRADTAQERSHLLAVGTFEPRKNFVRLIEAYARAKEHIGATIPPLLIVGAPGISLPEIRASIDAHGLADTVELRHGVDDAQLRALYQQAILTCIPSLYEGFGFTILEAMAAGSCVLGSSGSSVGEVIADCGILVEPLDVEHMAKGLVEGITDAALRERLSTQGTMRAKQFTWARCATQLNALYRKVARSKVRTSFATQSRQTGTQ